ncbi:MULTISPECIES: glutamine--fructose-6-phosphate transaminase (isomerizing) [unclassified Wenzhouxiangella]|uniref:glutamine--fructose-6-phosphate transaminase (isomerizing) n=1 Tax=unclassified Wenzhouxiangella TaxID=2613841 RepID=UPI000E32BD1D|nr:MULTISPECIES: glutamine--fructose-6-phosphate transaminase (isomerizing) [unclassified Wenzhouxiangella]RFF27676.1 glutamine--fructose-6-phosphate transaminase (isomerizing) [Wenzhouxiangella sp. 15181]RFP69768.1 glutamine--fructose-6-phosphate transaminase (isomerizing) [Wenzhouxiangella sp. 15190]
MCGIVGATTARNITPILLEGLRRLEYRGYDSAGVAVLDGDAIEIRRAVGKVEALADSLAADPLESHTGIAHTRWATHGKPTEANAHPHRSGHRLAVVHNGIIENYEQLRHELQSAGFQFASETDTEVIAHLIAREMDQQDDFVTAFSRAVARLEGAYALAAVTPQDPEAIYLARMGSPLVIGVSTEESYIASDPLALLQVTDRFIHLENGDLARVDRQGARLFDLEGNTLEREAERYAHEDQVANKGDYRHFMLKEIHEQPEAVANSLADKLGSHGVLTESLGPEANAILPKIENIHIIACGTSYHAGLVARYWIESIAGIPVNVEVASEYRYREPVAPPNTLFIGISQSGETADTLAALRFAKENDYLQTLALCNMPGSTLVRESGLRLLTHAGIEIGVASTKAFTTQLAALYWLALVLGRARGRLDAADEEKAVATLRALPRLMEDALELEEDVKHVAETFVDKHHALFLGRGTHFPIALEGALKLKEISYIHAEAYPAGELKHGPLALVDEDMPVVTVAPDDHLLGKLRSNLEEVRARGGQLINFIAENVDMHDGEGTTNIQVPGMNDSTSPIIATLPLQLLAYHVALLKGTDVDKPRNLAKSVTVE